MKKILLFLLAITHISAFAQNVGIGTSTPHSSAKLHIESANSGLLIPSVSLIANNNALSPVNSPEIGLLVYNNNAAMTNGQGVGFYYWNGTIWEKLGFDSNKWSLLGNAGTVDGTNFIGTTDNVPFSVRVNNQKSGRIDMALQSTFWGYLSGNANTALGNTGNGYRALSANTSGQSNTAIGNASLQGNTIGSGNTAVGANALLANSTGRNNTAAGLDALSTNTAGDANVAMGYRSLDMNFNGSRNTAIGTDALSRTTIGANNTAVGNGAGLVNINGANNTYLGNFAGPSAGFTALTNATAIGANAIVNQSNALILGSGVNVGVGTSTPNASALLDLTATNRGVLIPRIALTTTTSNLPVTAPATSLLVYNSATIADVTPGYYYWNGVAWVRFLNTQSNDWTILGNANTVDGTNFVGTTDNIPFNIRVNNQKAGRIDPTLANATWGYMAGNSNSTGTNLVAMGDSALYNNTAAANTAVGSKALLTNSTGQQNSAFGTGALYSNTVANFNSAFGYRALYNNTFNLLGYDRFANGSRNSAFGNEALFSNTIGKKNSALGNQALYSNSSGSYNTADGEQSLFSNTIGTNNSAIGQEALFSNTTGFSNSAIGQRALFTNTTGGQNSAFGAGADVATANLTNATVIGFGAIVDASNKIQLGNAAVTNVNSSGTYTAGAVTYPNAHGTTGQVLSTTGTGTLVWSSPTAGANGIDGQSAYQVAVTNGYVGTEAQWLASLQGATGATGSAGADGALNAWSLLGNAGTVDGTNFIGTTDNIPFNIRVNNQKAGRIDLANSFWGYQAGNLTTGIRNTATGYRALASNITGLNNTAMGFQALLSSTGFGNNSAFGYSALSTNSSGNDNSAFGVSALSTNTTGGQNSAFGAGANVATANLTNATAIGFGAIVDASNQMQLGNASLTTVMSSGNVVVSNPTISAINATATATAAQLVTGYITSTSTAATNILLPTAAAIVGQLGGTVSQGTSFEFTVDNSAGLNTVTLLVNTGITVPTSAVTGGSTMTVSIANKVGRFRLTFTSATSAVLFRIF